jgi:hypothetical protein
VPAAAASDPPLGGHPCDGGEAHAGDPADHVEDRRNSIDSTDRLDVCGKIGGCHPVILTPSVVRRQSPAALFRRRNFQHVDGVDREMGALAPGEGHRQADMEREDPLA